MRALIAAGLLLGNCVLGTLLSAQEPAAANNPTVIIVTLSSGREFAGVADRRSDEEVLWLRTGNGTASVSRPIEWSAIAGMKNGWDDAALKAEEVRQLAVNDDGRLPAGGAVRDIQPGRIVVINAAPALSSTSRPQVARAIPTSLRIDAAVENFDEDTENDGLIVELRMLDQHGKAIPFNGTAHIRWVGPQARKNTAQSPPRGIVLGDWSVPVTSSGSTQPVQITLPFQVRNPERDLTLWNYSRVEVALNMPGVGNFAAERDGVRIRRWEPHRDFQQVHQNGPIVTRSSRRP